MIRNKKEYPQKLIVLQKSIFDFYSPRYQWRLNVATWHQLSIFPLFHDCQMGECHQRSKLQTWILILAPNGIRRQPNFVIQVPRFHGFLRSLCFHFTNKNATTLESPGCTCKHDHLTMATSKEPVLVQKNRWIFNFKVFHVKSWDLFFFSGDVPYIQILFLPVNKTALRLFHVIRPQASSADKLECGSCLVDVVPTRHGMMVMV